MKELLAQTTRKARKAHTCMACEWLVNDNPLSFGELTFSERKAVVRAWRRNWQIVSGQQYIDQRIAQDGRVYTFKAIPEIHRICLKYEVYPDD